MLSAREKIEGKGMLHPDSISLPFLVHEYERKDYHLLAAAKKSRHLISIAESGGLALLRKLVTRDKENHIDWTQFLTILKTVVGPRRITYFPGNTILKMGLGPRRVTVFFLLKPY